ncbi:MAG: hypothetical protein HYX53_02565 [Chloroflexi bacterium]|nr:hypothetical protein [Chloroflexota bacterium]
MKQVAPYERFPTGGWDIGILKANPEDLASRFGIEFAEDSDDFDRFALAALDGDAVGQLWLFRYLRSPGPGTEVLVDVTVSRTDALAAVKRTLGLSRKDFLWINPEPRSKFKPAASRLAATPAPH